MSGRQDSRLGWMVPVPVVVGEFGPGGGPEIEEWSRNHDSDSDIMIQVVAFLGGVHNYGGGPACQPRDSESDSESAERPHWLSPGLAVTLRLAP